MILSRARRLIGPWDPQHYLYDRCRNAQPARRCDESAERGARIVTKHQVVWSTQVRTIPIRRKPCRWV